MFRSLRPGIVHETADPPAGGGAPAEPAAAAPAGDAPAPAERPEWLEEKFWDSEARAPRVEQLAASYREIQTAFSGRVDKLKEEITASLREGVPEKPEGYEITLPEDLLPAGFKAEVPADDPFLNEMKGLFHELGAKPEMFQKAAEAFLRWQVANMPDVAAQRAALGEGAEERLTAIDQYLAKNLPDAQYGALSAALMTAEGIMAIETLLAGRGGIGPRPGNQGPATAKTTLSPEQAKELTSHPDYNHPVKGEAMRKQFAEFVSQGGKVPGYTG